MQSNSLRTNQSQTDSSLSNPRIDRVGLTRRTLLKSGLAAAGGALFGPSVATSRAHASAGPAKARSVIQIWMWGGPAHLDTFDPKPDAGNDYCGPLNKPIETNVPGVQIGELLPELAQQADKYAILRGMTHGINAHETASYTVQTGRESGGRIVYPSVGAVVNRFKGYDGGYAGLIPPYIVLTQPQGRFSEAGFLGTRYKPFATGGNPAQSRFIVEGVVAEGMTDEHQRARRDLLRNLNGFGRAMRGSPKMQSFTKCEDQAYDLILGDGRKVFDLSEEKRELRDKYGRNTFGQSCLIARRLVEKGVRFVTINYKGWDTHKQHFQTMRRKLPELDRGMATLLQDLSDHGLLDETIVWWSGEFGRTPRVQWDPPWNGGRGHYGRAFSAVVAGGGFQGGQVVGSTDARGESVQNRPIYPWDLIGSMYELLGIDPKTTIPHPNGGEIALALSAKDGVESGGHLTEIM